MKQMGSLFPRLAFSIAFVFIFSLGLGHADDASSNAVAAPPAGLVPANVRLADILALHEKAIGSLTPGVGNNTTESWTFTDSGISGTEQLDRSGTNYRSRITQGPFSEEYGQFNGNRWHYDYNSLSSSTTWLDDRSFYISRVLEDASDPKNDVTVLGLTTGDKPAYVLQIKMPGYKNPEWVFYDKTTGLITRIEHVAGKHRVVNTYDDYRTVDGLTTPWHVHDSDGRPELDDDYHTTSLKYNIVFTDTVFQAPPTNSSIAQQNVSAKIPLNIPEDDTGDDAIVRVMVGNRGLDFLIDSGSPGSSIDWTVARELGLPTYGQVTQLANGTHLEYETKLQAATLGPISLSNFAVDVEDMNYTPADGTKVVGTLGADFLSTHFFKLDYVNHVFEIISNTDLTKVLPQDAMQIPVTLDDSAPYIVMDLAGGHTDRVLFDNSMMLSMVFGQYIDAHEANFVDISKGDHQTWVLPFSDGDSYGLSADVWIAKASNFTVANLNYTDQDIIGTDVPFETSYTKVDAVLGYDVIGYFDVYFALPDNAIYLSPNQWFHEHFKTAPNH